MPAFDYICKKNHVTEHFLKKFQESIICGFENCTLVADYQPSFNYTSQAAQRFTPIVIHRDASGNIRYPGRADAPAPPGFQKVELKDFHQVRRFEKEVNERDSVRAEEFRNTRQQFLSGQLKENRRVMEGLVKNFSPRGRKFYELMKQASMSKEAAGRSSSNPAFFIEALTQDSSNREGYCDAANDWGKNQGNRK